jgi:hypothetical protein
VDDRYAQVAKDAGFSLHAGVAAQGSERDKLERLCRYILRSAVSEKRLSLTSAGNIRYQSYKGQALFKNTYLKSKKTFEFRN